MKKKLMQEVQQQQSQKKKPEKRKRGGEEQPEKTKEEQLDLSSLFALPDSRPHSRRPSLEGVEIKDQCGQKGAPSPSITPKQLQGKMVVAMTPPSHSKIGALLSTAIRPPTSIQKKRLLFLQNAEKEKQGKREEGEERAERGETKENESDAASSTAATTPKLKKKKKKEKLEVKESAPSPGVASSTATTPEVKQKTSAMNGKATPPNKRVKSQLDSNGNGVAKGAKEEEGGAEEWLDMKAFVPVRTEESAERKRLKEENRLKKKKKKPVIDREQEDEEPEPTVPKPDTVHSSPTVSHSKPGTVLPCLGLVGSLNGTVSRPEGTVAQPLAATVHSKSRPMVDTVHHPVMNGTSKKEVATPKHIRFSSESPVKPATLSPAATVSSSPAKSIDNGRSEEPKGGKLTRSRMKRFSSPEVSTTSSDSDGNGQKEAARRKKLTKKPEVTSSKASKMTPSTPKATVPHSLNGTVSAKKKPLPPTVSPTVPLEKSSKEEEVRKEKKKEGKKIKKRKSKGVEEKEAEPEKKEKEKEEEEEEERQRPSSDLLQMVAARLANSHGLLVFRLISNETRRIAERHLRQADAVLHLEEFDDENAFTRDDMEQWWEEKREAEDTTVAEGKENRSHTQISAYLQMRAVEKKLLKDMDGGLSHPSSAASAVDPVQLLQHPLETLDAACLLHESQTAAAARLLQQEGRQLGEVWLGHASAKLVRELRRLTTIERFEHRQATMATLEKLPLLQMTELRLDIVDEEATRGALADHLVNGKNLRALELNVAPHGPLDGNTASHYTLFTRRTYDRGDYTDDLEWMIPNVEDGEPDPVTLCMPELEHLSTNVANVKLFWQLRPSSGLLQQLQSLRVGTLSRTKELIASSELFADTKEARRYKQPGFFALRDADDSVLESVTLRLADRVGVARLQRETATLFEAIGELPPSLRRLSISLFYNQFGGVCAPFRKWAEADAAADAPDTDHIHIEEMHLHFERAFDLRGLPLLLPLSIKTLSIAVNYENEDDARCLGPFIEMLSGLERLENLEDLHIQVWGVRCLQPVVAAVAACSSLAARLTRLAVGAYPVDDDFFEPSSFSSWLLSSLSSFPRVRSLGLHAAVLVRMVPEERRSGYSWRNGLAWLANESLTGKWIQSDSAHSDETPPLEAIELAAAPALPVLDDGEDYTITPHWEVHYDAAALVLSEEDEGENEEMEDDSFAIPHGSSDEDDDFITDGEDEEEGHAGDASRDDLDKMEEGLEDETERIERRESRRDEKVRAAIERGEMEEGEEEEEGEVIDFDSISDEEEEETQPKSEFFDDEAVESDREESGDEDEEGGKHEESADSECSSEDDDEQREEERMKEEGRRQKRIERKQAKVDELDSKKRKRALESDDDEEEIVVRRAPANKRKKVIIESDDE